MKIRNKIVSSSAPIAALLLGGAVLTCGRVQAAVLLPGGSSPATIGSTTGRQIADETFTITGVDTLGAPRYTASVESEVIEESTGKLDFAYQVTNITSPSEPDSIHTISLLGYYGFTTDVNYVSGTGTVNYDTAQRSPVIGISLSLDYTQPANAIAPGDSTDWMLVKTNATSYDNNGTVTLIDGATAIVGGFEPAVPEPVSFGMLALGGISLLGRRPGRKLS